MFLSFFCLWSKNAGYYTPSEMFEGTRARISLWGIPEVHYNSESAVFIAVQNENNGISNSMVAGFHVQPRLYSGSTDLRFFVGWMTGNDGKACYSITCQGFVVSNVSGAPVPGAIPRPLSTYNGEDYFITLSIKKDEKTLDWSLYQDDNGNPILIGWWPKTLFDNTFDYATIIAWVGNVFYPSNERSPPMGSGHYAVEGAHKAAYISHIKIFDQNGQAMDPYIVRDLADRKDCFTTDDFKYSHHVGYHFYYGGPSGCQN
ncbi:NEP-interacting protein (DUF239) [Rhynchospora pubera]|uniref:NEP-interacting protein (DUF239) n=1 Tax=Rhynchospora pubera TaxID=906938 RepID=A0AAV8CW38_9POAL|nr:NEP-interacting protein (DUF239) [Rhynchospora pubera]